MNSLAGIEAPRRILYINVSRIGDTLLATPAVRAVAAAFPHAEITLLGHPKRYEVLENLPFVHRIGAITKYSAQWRGWQPGKRYDIAFVHGYDKAIVSYALRDSHHVIAFSQPDKAINERLFRAVTFPPFQTEHAVHIQLRLPGAIGIPPAGFHLAYQVSAQETQWAREQLRQLELASDAPLIGLQVASFPTKAYRDWPIESFIDLTNRICAHWPNSHFLVFGGSEEKVKTAQLADHLKASGTLYAGRLSLRQTAALMNEVTLYVGVDTGPTHIMGALHRPMVVLYHGYSPSRVLAPLDHPCIRVIDHPLADQGATPATPMAEISVDTVWQNVHAMLDESHTKGA